jgi:dihydrofolate synthase/folylpolyglutamate synthase
VSIAFQKKAPPEEWVFSPVPEVEKAIQDVREQYPQSYPENLDRMRLFLDKLGNPHLKLPFVFHAAGTNGKGSTLAFLQAIFESSGLTVHKYTSPHLVRFEERIIIGGKIITSDLLLELIGACRAAARGSEISFFEFFTALAFLAFSRNPADVLLLETGLGGLFDATNVVEGNCLSVLTPISYDHIHVLGATLPEIAAHKAGIIKDGCACVSASQEPAVMEVFKAKAEALAAPFRMRERDWDVIPKDSGFEYKSDRHQFVLPLPRLQGRHQIFNAGLALAALESSPYAPLLEQKMLEQAMRQVNWPGRLQKITGGALAALLPAGWELWLDGAHNDSGAETIAAQAAAWKPDMPLHLITAMKRTKDVSGFYNHILPHTLSIQAVDVRWMEAPMLTAEMLCNKIRQMGYETVKTAPNLESAIRALSFQFQSPQRILIAGSLYLVGHALQKGF